MRTRDDMQVQTVYITNVKEVTGKSDEWISVDGNTLRRLLEKLSSIYGPRFRATVFSPQGDDVSDYVAIFINGESYHVRGGLEATLNERDTVLIGMTMAGGS